MPEMSWLVKGVMVGFIALLILAIAAYHLIFGARRPQDGDQAAAPAEADQARARSARAA